MSQIWGFAEVKENTQPYRWMRPEFMVPVANKSSARRVMRSAAFRARKSRSVALGGKFSMVLGRKRSMTVFLRSILLGDQYA